MLLQELSKLLNEGAVADRYEELKDTAQKCSTYMCIDARPAAGEEIGSLLVSIVPPTIGHKVQVGKGDFVARIMITGSIDNQKPMSQLFMVDEKTFAEFTQMPHSKPDVEGFLPYEYEGDECDVVKDGTRFIIKVDKDLTQMPASLFNKEYRMK